MKKLVILLVAFSTFSCQSQEKKNAFLENKLKEREPYYGQAKKRLSGSEINLKNLIANIQ